MRIPVWASELADEFWREARVPERYPRDLHTAIPRALPLSVLTIADLSLGKLREWLGDTGIICNLQNRDRHLRAGLFARNGKGIAFLDGADSPGEQCYSLAHELAHFLRDYWKLRRQVEVRLGRTALEVFDGHRSPRPDERLHSLLRFTPIRLYLHLLDRDSDGKPANATIAEVEEDADRLAFEILAPGRHVAANIADWRDRNALLRALVNDYGLPSQQAVRYVEVLLAPGTASDPFLRRLKIVK